MVAAEFSGRNNKVFILSSVEKHRERAGQAALSFSATFWRLYFFYQHNST